MEKLGDGNGIYLRFCGPGNNIRHNYVHHITGAGTNSAIRCDGSQRLAYIFENVIYECVSGGILFKEINFVENNIVANMSNIRRGYISVRPKSGDSPDGSTILRNICYNSGGYVDFYDDPSNEVNDCNSNFNLFYHSPDPALSADYIATLQSNGTDLNSISADPLFVDINNGDLNLLPNSLAITQLGFKDVDFDCMGLFWPWDLDCDNDTDISDIAELSSDWLRDDLCDVYERNGDLNYDCNVNNFDFAVLAEHFMEPQEQEKGPIAWWKFDQGTGIAAGDSSGNDYDGAITGASWVPGHDGNALDFEGADYISIPADVFSSTEYTNQISIAFWQYGDASIQPQNDTIFRASDSNNDRVLNIHIPWGNENIVWDAGNIGSSYDRINKYATDASEYEGQWNHWVFTKNVSTGQMKIYLNSSLWHNEGNKVMPIEGITSVRIGSNYNGASNYDGIIDGFRIYDYELTAVEINNIYNE
jgi:hypothetical protein